MVSEADYRSTSVHFSSNNFQLWTLQFQLIKLNINEDWFTITDISDIKKYWTLTTNFWIFFEAKSPCQSHDPLATASWMLRLHAFSTRFGFNHNIWLPMNKISKIEHDYVETLHALLRRINNLIWALWLLKYFTGVSLKKSRKQHGHVELRHKDTMNNAIHSLFIFFFNLH